MSIRGRQSGWPVRRLTIDHISFTSTANFGTLSRSRLGSEEAARVIPAGYKCSNAN